ncbi:MAG: AraC family transcriptional regulator [Myxococcota bacterium]
MSEGLPVVLASARTLRPLLAGLTAQGIDVAPVFAAQGIDPAALADPDARVPARAVHELWRRSAELSNNPDFGLALSQHVQPGSFDVLDYLGRNAANVGAGLQQYCRYTQLLHDGIRATVEEGEDTVRLRHVLSDGTVLPRQYAEFIVATILAIARQASGERIIPVRVHFLHSEPEDLTQHRAIFGCPVRFASDSNGFELHRSDYDRPLRRAEEKLFRVLEQHAEHLLEKLPRPSSLVAQVRSAIVHDLGSGNLSSRLVAQSLGTSERTLRRRLDAEGTSYQQILTELRTELAIRYMDERDISTDEVALLLGFSDRTAFNRAFRQWTGRSPAEFRSQRRPH